MFPNKTRKKIDEQIIQITKLLNDIYKNKSSDEYKMRGDITKVSMYSTIEKMVAQLSILRGFSKTDASDLNQLFNTLHRPFFKNMVSEFMHEPNERNTVFCALFTLGYRLLVGELSRIFASTEATPKGIEYKPNKISRKNDISRIIAIYKGDLEARINAEIRVSSSAKTSIEESFIENMIRDLYIQEYYEENVNPYQEGHFGFREIRGDSPDMERLTGSTKRPRSDDTDVVISKLPQIKGSRPLYDDSERPREYGGLEEPILKRIKEEENTSSDSNTDTADSDSISTATDPSYGSSVSSIDECNQCNQYKPVQESVTDRMIDFSDKVGDVADKVGPKIANIAAWAAPIAMGLDLFAAIFNKIARFATGKNPIAELNYYFTNKYEKTIQKFNSVSANYLATKEAYDEYMKIPDAQRKKKVESKYLQNMEKYNIQMKNLEAQIEHFNSRAKKDTSKPAPKSEPPKTNTSSKTDNGGGNNNDDDFDF